jgi:excinuclease ABC subunit A
LAIATGTPEEVAAEPASHTGRFLSGILTPVAKSAGTRSGESAKPKRRAKVAA